MNTIMLQNGSLMKVAVADVSGQTTPQTVKVNKNNSRFCFQFVLEEVKSMPEKPFKDREEVKKEIEQFFAIGLFDSCLGVIFAIIGVVADALDMTLVLEPTSWFLLAIFFGVLGVWPIMKSAVAKSLYGIESESKNK